MTEAKPGALRRILAGLPLALISPLLIVLAAVALGLTNIVSKYRARRPVPPPKRPRNSSASIVIPNWNGRDLLEKYLPSVVEAAAQLPGSEVIVVDNGSTDGSAAFVQEQFPHVRLLALPENLGFGAGSNAGFEAATSDVVVLLNSDMRVEPDFLQPLLDGFTDELVFSVSCQIFFSDPDKVREETGLTQFWWERGSVRVRHRIDPAVNRLFPCAYGGGGSCAFDRDKFLELGGFDELLAPFYLEDTDLGYMAWKRGWKNLYQPASVVYHEHRGTIGRRFSDGYIQGILKKNYLLFTWKNIHEPGRLLEHLFYAWTSAFVSWLAGDSPERSSFTGLARAVLQLPRAVASRSRALRLAAVPDTEALRRPLGGHYWDTFGSPSSPSDPLRVLFVAPYPICPPIHGGGVFMYQSVHELALLSDLHAIILLDRPEERAAHRELDHLCRSTEYLVRPTGVPSRLGSIEPHAVHEFRIPDLEWLIHRQIYLRRIDVVQLEYTVLGQYAARFRHIPCMLFEHDVYFQSIARRLPFMKSLTEQWKARWEYLRALRWELRILPNVDRVQVCSKENGDYLLSFLPELAGRIDDGFRAGIDTARYAYHTEAREPLTMLFLGNFRHTPNQEALDWFLDRVLPLIRSAQPDARLLIVGSEMPDREFLQARDGVEWVGFVDDIREPLARYALFVCPILSGSGVRVKLLEAFAAGIPVVSTRLGAEGLAAVDGEICALADAPEDFAGHVIDLLVNPSMAAAMAARARQEVVERRDMRVMTEKLVANYRSEIAKKQATFP